MRIALNKTFGFEAAHWLPRFPESHKCRRMHGHSYRVDVVVEGEVDPTEGCLIDFGLIAKAFDPLLAALDHYVLNDVTGLENPTAEVLAKWVYDRLKPSLPLLARVRIHETCTSSAEYAGL